MTTMTKVKICGIQESAEALTASQAGADFIGMVFVPGLRRQVSIHKAQEVMSALRDESESPPPVVGLFANQPINKVNDTIRLCGLNMAQLCGQESVDYCGQVEVPVIKVAHVKASWEVELAVQTLAQELTSLTGHGHRVTLDRKVEGLPGGTGEAFNWEIARRLSALGYSFFLAGGLLPDNIAEAVRTAQPWGVDISSGVETGGRKDSAKIRSFIRRVRETDALLAGDRAARPEKE